MSDGPTLIPVSNEMLDDAKGFNLVLQHILDPDRTVSDAWAAERAEQEALRRDFIWMLKDRLGDARQAFEDGWPDHCGCC